ncbi:MAG: 1-acyl-sn-glycerol-3-phosphate acyltransferase [Myxococcales bacterium]|nr:1-acyl-sn-glycerol-3-phosphate acyltransferase [Myxococcales bacterium]
MSLLSRFRVPRVGLQPRELDARDPQLIARMADLVSKTIVRYHRAEVRGVERVPAGGALYVGNHNSWAYTPDTVIFCDAVYRAHGVSAVPRGLAHSLPMKVPLLGPLLLRIGAVQANHGNAEALLARGDKVLVYPGGDVEAARPFRKRHQIDFDGRRGYVRLALRAKVPIVPVVAAGAHATTIVIDDLRWLASLLGVDKLFRLKVWPLTLSFPLGLTLGPLPLFIPFPTRILVELLEPITFERGGERAAADDAYVRACADRVEATMQSALTRLASEL